MKKEPYWKWIMGNLDNWTQDDVNSIKWHLLTVKNIKTDGMNNDELYGLLQDCICKYTETAAEESACVCAETKNAFGRLYKEYEDALIKDALEKTNYNIKKGEWDTWVNKSRKTLQDEEFNKGPVTYNPCDGELMEVGRPSLLYYNCKRNPAAVEKHLQELIAGNPPPIQTVVNVPNVPTLNLVCCSQTFSNISADKVSMKDINQTCKLLVIGSDGKTIDSKEASGDTSAEAKAAVKNFKEEDDVPEVVPNNTGLYIIITLVILLICSSSCSIIVLGGGVMLMSQ
jgi:hypothetical protein